MKDYGFKKATEFTRKQINVIWVKAKNGELKVEKWMMTNFYDLADFYGYDYNRSVEYHEGKILRILESVFAGELEKAQEKINDYTESLYEDLSFKRRKEIDRSLVA